MLAGLQPKLNDNQLQAQLPDFDREHSSRVPEGFRGYRIP
jgi:hypothetical protein